MHPTKGDGSAFGRQSVEAFGVTKGAEPSGAEVVPAMG
jgi:hypothetical protein